MKQILRLSFPLLTCLFLAVNVHADKKENSVKAESGVITIYINGNRQEFTLADAISKNGVGVDLDRILEKLPADIQMLIMQADKKQQKDAENVKGGKDDQGDNKRIDIKISNAFKIGPDGEFSAIKLGEKELEELAIPEDVKKKIKAVEEMGIQISGKGFSIGPDVKNNTTMILNNDTDIIELLKRYQLHGSKKARMAEVMKKEGKNDKKTDGDKLDLILKRLDQMDKKIQALQQKVDG